MHKTPLLDQLESGPWPSFIKDLKRIAGRKKAAADLLGVLERSYKDKITHWKHGGIVGVLGYGSGIIGRYTDLPEEFPGVEHFPTVRVNQPAVSGMTMNTTTEVISTLAGTTTCATPQRNITIGAKATSMIKSFTATCTSV